MELYPVEVKGWHGYINENGEVAIEPKFSQARLFREGLAAVKHNKKWGFIEPSGE